jgi:hypothetical protein
MRSRLGLQESREVASSGHGIASILEEAAVGQQQHLDEKKGKSADKIDDWRLFTRR